MFWQNKENDRDVKIFKRVVQLFRDGDLIFRKFHCFDGEIDLDTFRLCHERIYVSGVQLDVKKSRIRDFYNEVDGWYKDSLKRHDDGVKDGVLGRLFE